MKKIIIGLGFFGLLAGSTTAVFAGYFNNISVNTCDTQITNTLQVGSENSDVYVLQSMLSHAGYLQARPNGYFGQGTKSAVMSFQRDNNISVTGFVGEATRNAVNERLCDTDVRGDTLSYNNYGYASGITYVDQYDPYALVVSPQITAPAVYATPQADNLVYPNSVNNNVLQTSSNGYQASNINQIPSSNVIIPATSQIQSTGIVYNPSSGYSYGVVPKPGSLTITTPFTNAVYNEGDTVYLAWTTNNLNASQFQILVENTSTRQSKQVAVTASNSVSFILTKEVLDAVCSGTCDNNQQGSFKIVIATPVTDIAGVTSTFRAAVAPITIKRPYGFSGTVSVTASKTPVNSGEIFKLYVNIPTGASWNANLYGNYSIKMRAICPTSVSVSIAGVPCGQDFTIPLAPVSFQQEIPTMITNSTWYRQDVTFEIVVSNLLGQVIGTSRTNVIVNAAPFSW